MNRKSIPKSLSDKRTVIIPTKFGNISTVYPIDNKEPLLLKGFLDNLEGDVDIIRSGVPRDLFTKETCEKCNTNLLVSTRMLDIHWDGFICPCCTHINKL